ncbi:MAG TPA: SIMPL domain-containing protein [Pyrinomonadaceae bacterium]|nr:SIMPL domain-containing protein [Pyrinomonadaceae bacterium]
MKPTLRAATAVILALLAASATASAEDKPEPRLVTVAGEAEVKVAPDEVVFDLTVSTFNKDLRLAKSQTDERLKNVIALAKKHGVAEADTQTDYINLVPHYRGNNEARALLGYTVRKDLVLTLRDVARAEGLLSELLAGDVTRVNSVSFRSSQMRKYRDQARDMAMKAAREKAAALAAAVGQKIGKAYSIEEEAPTRSYAAQNSLSVNTSSSVESGDSTASEGTLALGLIKINARVTVKFELE